MGAVGGSVIGGLFGGVILSGAVGIVVVAVTRKK